MSRVVLSLGSNLADPTAQLRAAGRELAPCTVARSSMYATDAWGPVPQNDYLNAVIIAVDAGADAHMWLARAQDLESAAGRARTVRWGPRTLDVDVITVDDVRSDEPELVLPHPRAATRAFVLVPWLSIDAAAYLPGAGPVRELVRSLHADEVAGVRARPELDWAG